MALLLHAAALGGLDWAWPTTEPAAQPVAAMQVRVVDPAPEPRPAEAPMNPSPPVKMAEPTAAAPPPRVRTRLVAAR
ncbi:MAG TPA: hypothetical protein VNU48_09100, partial [Burkholderiaceae bacterium]|nr:hypothetical protein [Burkholderiaceae bacterium]